MFQGRKDGLIQREVISQAQCLTIGRTLGDLDSVGDSC